MKREERMKQTSSVKSTKRALVASAACTLLCGLLLFSTSVAWFTATKESTLNVIYSGNLDVELKYSKDMTNWSDVEGKNNIFNNVNDQPMLWEPGAVNVVYFKIENKGSLAAKYDFALEIAEEKEGTNFNNNELKLSNYIKGGIVENVEAAYGATDEGRAAAIGAITKERTLAALCTEPMKTDTLDGSTVSTEQVKTYALVLYMPDDPVTGEATNYKTPDNETETPRPSVKLRVKLVATQMTGEADSFGDQYDKDAYENMLMTADAD